MLALAWGASASAETLEGLLQKVIENHDRIVAAKAEVDAARHRAREALGDWFPTLTPNYNYGWEKQNKPAAAATTSTAFTEFDVKLKQLLWDFGSSNAQIEKGRLKLLQAEVSLVAKRQDLMLEAATAYVNLLRTDRVLGFARQSEGNIRRQTGLEEARVETGMGLSTDVLQAKTQLAGAEARRIQASGTNVSAKNRYWAVFGEVPGEISTFESVIVPPERLPSDLGTAVSMALEHNTDLMLANLAEATAREDVRGTTGKEFFPKIEGVVERKFKHNVGGTIDNQHETLAKVEMSLPFNLGLTAINTLRASQSDLLARTRTVADSRTKVEEQVRNAWISLNTALATTNSLRNQADIASAFLELARQERQLGTRSLIDLLSGETSLINAQSDTTSAEVDVLIATFQLLKVMGRLNYDSFQSAAPLTLDELLKRRAGAPAGARSFTGPVFKDAETVRLADALFPSPGETKPLRPLPEVGSSSDAGRGYGDASEEARAGDRIGKYDPAAGAAGERQAASAPPAPTPVVPEPKTQPPSAEWTMVGLLDALRSIFSVFSIPGSSATSVPPAGAPAFAEEKPPRPAAPPPAAQPTRAGDSPAKTENQGAPEFGLVEFLAAVLKAFGLAAGAPGSAAVAPPA